MSYEDWYELKNLSIIAGRSFIKGLTFSRASFPRRPVFLIIVDLNRGIVNIKKLAYVARPDEKADENKSKAGQYFHKALAETLFKACSDAFEENQRS
jgi:hypothetical protein